MKRTLLMSALLLTTFLMGQNVEKKKDKKEKDKIDEVNSLNPKKKESDFYFGANAGVNFNHFNRAGTDYGFQVGGLVFYKLGEFYNLSSGIAYNQIGGQAVDREVYSVISKTPVTQRDFLNRGIRMHSIEIPLKIHFSKYDILNEEQVSKKRSIRPDFSLGFTYNAVLYASERRDELWYSSTNDALGKPIKTLVNNRKENVTSSYQTHLFSFVVGSSVYIPVTEKMDYFFGANYKIGLQNIKATPYPYAGNMSTNQFNIQMGVTFN